MVVNIVLQTEINKKENKLYPFRQRDFHPNFKVLPVTGKFYARHDFPDSSLLDPSIENAILKKQMLLSKDKFKEPITTSMEYGWYSIPKTATPPYTFYYPKTSTWITQIGALISIEDQKNPKKPFTGIPFKL